MKYFGAFFYALWKDWLGRISSVGSLGFAIYALWGTSDIVYQRPVFLIISFVLFIYTSYWIWRDEYVKSLHDVRILFSNGEPYVRTIRNHAYRAGPDTDIQIKVKNFGLKTEGVEVFAKLESNSESTGVPLSLSGNREVTTFLLRYEEEQFVQLLHYRRQEGARLMKFHSTATNYNASLIHLEPSDTDTIVITLRGDGIHLSRRFRLSLEENDVILIEPN